MSKEFLALDLGPLPIDAVNAVLGTELEMGSVHMSGAAHRHVAEDHPGDYAQYFHQLAAVIANPTFIGQAPKHKENFELIRRLPGTNGAALLVAVSIDRDDQGRYRVRSVYALTPARLEAKRAKGTIKLAPKNDNAAPMTVAAKRVRGRLPIRHLFRPRFRRVNRVGYSALRVARPVGRPFPPQRTAIEWRMQRFKIKPWVGPPATN